MGYSTVNTAARNIKLTAAELEEVRNAGGVSFRPSTSGLTCNQVPRLKHLTSRQADNIRSQVWPARNVKNADVREREHKRIQTVHRDANGDVRCHGCGQKNESVPLGKVSCGRCGLPWKVEKTSRDTQFRPQPFRNTSYDEYSPRPYDRRPYSWPW